MYKYSILALIAYTYLKTLPNSHHQESPCTYKVTNIWQLQCTSKLMCQYKNIAKLVFYFQLHSLWLIRSENSGNV